LEGSIKIPSLEEKFTKRRFSPEKPRGKNENSNPHVQGYIYTTPCGYSFVHKKWLSNEEIPVYPFEKISFWIFWVCVISGEKSIYIFHH